MKRRLFLFVMVITFLAGFGAILHDTGWGNCKPGISASFIPDKTAFLQLAACEFRVVI